jgi:hypothetical protein
VVVIESNTLLCGKDILYLLLSHETHLQNEKQPVLPSSPKEGYQLHTVKTTSK